MLVLAIVFGVALAACGGNSSDETTTTSSTTTSSSTTTTPPPTAPPSTQATVPNITCRVGQLDASLTNPDAGAGQRYVTLIFTNHSTSPCTMLGYIGLQLVGMSGSLPTSVTRNNNPGFPKVVITIAPGSQAFTVLHWAGIPAPDEPQGGQCEPTPQQVRITPPNETNFLLESWTFGEVCYHGTIDVNAMKLGSGM